MLRDRCPDCNTKDEAYAGELPARNAATALAWGGALVEAYPCPAGNGMWHVPRPQGPRPSTVARSQKVAA